MPVVARVGLRLFAVVGGAIAAVLLTAVIVEPFVAVVVVLPLAILGGFQTAAYLLIGLWRSSEGGAHPPEVKESPPDVSRGPSG